MWGVLILVLIVILLIFKILKSRENFWEKNGVRQIQTSTLLEKLLLLVGRRSLADFDGVAYREMEKSGLKFIGTVEVTRPLLIVKDVEVLRNIFIKDFSHFTDRPLIFLNRRQGVINKMLPNLRGEEWKCVRAQLSPSFTVGKIKRMMEHFDGVSQEWMDRLERDLIKSENGELTIKPKQEATNYSADVVAAALFGLHSGTVKDPDSKFSRMVHKLSEFSAGDVIKLVLSNGFPKLWDMLSLPVFDTKAMIFFSTLFTQEMRSREEENRKRNDFLQFLTDAQKYDFNMNRDKKKPSELSETSDSSDSETNVKLQNAPEKQNIVFDEMLATAQAMIIFMGGFFPSGSNLALLMYEIAANPDVQKKLREEINSRLFSKGNGERIDHDELNSLPYLDMVFCETLRRYAPMERIERVCTKEYYDPVNNLRVPEGAVIGIPVCSIHHDKQHYEHPDKFYPEHFSPENKAKRSSYSFLSYGSGKRNCIGLRFSTVFTKTAIAHLVHRFEIEPSPETPTPIKVDSFGVGAHAPENLRLILRPITTS